MASLTQWTGVWANSRRWWRTGKPGMLQSMGSQRVRHCWATEQLQTMVSNKDKTGTLLVAERLRSHLSKTGLSIPGRGLRAHMPQGNYPNCHNYWTGTLWSPCNTIREKPAGHSRRFCMPHLRPKAARQMHKTKQNTSGFSNTLSDVKQTRRWIPQCISCSFSYPQWMDTVDFTDMYLTALVNWELYIVHGLFWI